MRAYYETHTRDELASEVLLCKERETRLPRPETCTTRSKAKERRREKKGRETPSESKRERERDRPRRKEKEETKGSGSRHDTTPISRGDSLLIHIVHLLFWGFRCLIV